MTYKLTNDIVQLLANAGVELSPEVQWDLRQVVEAHSAMRTSVLQDWVMQLPLREQGTLLTAVRGCDLTPKHPLDSLERRLVAAIRCAFMNPADPREVDIPGAFFSSVVPEPKQLSGIGHYPQHWFSHVWHAVEVLGYRHPITATRHKWLLFYEAMCKDQHTNPETREQMIARLSEDRIASNSVVS
jgi:hypothetical protein